MRVFHCNHGHILCLFRNKARYWSKKADRSWSLPFDLHDHIEPLEFLYTMLTQTARVRSLLDGAKTLPKSSTFSVKCSRCTNVTDGQQTDLR